MRGMQGADIRLGRTVIAGALACVALVFAMSFVQVARAADPAGATVQPAWKKAPVVPVFSTVMKTALKRSAVQGQKLGLRPRVFAKIGDSNTEMAGSFYGFTCASPQPALPSALAATVRRYNQVALPNVNPLPWCESGTSFSRHSAATQAGTFSSWPLHEIADLPDWGYLRKPVGCEPEQTPLECELEATRPRYAFIATGTNDVGMDMYFGIKPGSAIGKRLGPMISQVKSIGTIPVLCSLPPLLSNDPGFQVALDQAIENTNAGLFRLSRQWKIPFVNVWRAFDEPAMKNRGMANDGLHIGIFGSGGETVVTDPLPTTYLDSINFSKAALRFGANRRNLIMLKTLTRLDRALGIG